MNAHVVLNMLFRLFPDHFPPRAGWQCSWLRHKSSFFSIRKPLLDILYSLSVDVSICIWARKMDKCQMGWNLCLLQNVFFLMSQMPFFYYICQQFPFCLCLWDKPWLGDGKKQILETQKQHHQKKSLFGNMKPC